MPRAASGDYAQEPNMSFAKAIVVVVVLHLVAVGGIYAFSSLKARNIAQQAPSSHPAKDTAIEPATAGEAGGASPGAAGQPGVQQIQAPVVTYVKQPAGGKPADQAVKPPIKDATSSVKDSGAFYTVAKGDNPVAIAKKLHVGYDDLLKLNKITDPKKLKIGQKLRIPVKKKPTP